MNRFVDVKPDAWYADYVSLAVERKLMQGDPDGKFRPDDPVTRAEMATIAARLSMLIEELTDSDRMDLMRKIANAVVQVKSSAGLGSGVMLSGGRILTNAHVVGDDAEVYVIWTSPFADKALPRYYGKKYRVVKKSTEFDLALIDVPEVAGVDGYIELAEEWVNPSFDAVDRAHFAETLYTQGSPVGLSGVLSRGLFAGHKFYGSGFFLTIAGSINPGNSGGGIFDTAGRLVGIAVAKPADAMVDGIGFAVPPLAINAFLNA